MAEKSTSRNIIKITEKAVTKLTDGVKATQGGIMRRINDVLRKLDLSAQGTVKPSSANIRTMKVATEDMVDIVINDAYIKKVNTFTRNFPRIKRTTDKFYKAFPGFNRNKNVFRDLLNLNIDRTKVSLLEAGINQNVINPVIQLLQDGVTSGMAIQDMEESLRTTILGDNERLGGLERYTKQISRDTLNQYSRNYNESISMDLGLEWYYYSGSIIDDTRTYCMERAGQYFHKLEVEDVPAQWSGKIPGTNSSTIFTYAGGYNCRHIWMAVMIDVVPKSVIDRNIANGNYKP